MNWDDLHHCIRGTGFILCGILLECIFIRIPIVVLAIVGCIFALLGMIMLFAAPTKKSENNKTNTQENDSNKI